MFNFSRHELRIELTGVTVDLVIGSTDIDGYLDVGVVSAVALVVVVVEAVALLCLASLALGRVLFVVVVVAGRLLRLLGLFGRGGLRRWHGTTTCRLVAS